MRILFVLLAFSLLSTASHTSFAKKKRASSVSAKKHKTKSRRSKKTSYKNVKMPLLKLNQLAQLEYRQRVKYIKLIRRQIVELNRLQGDLNSARKNASLDKIMKNRLWALFMGQDL